MITMLFYHEDKDVYEFQEMPESTEEIVDCWGSWYMSKRINQSLLGYNPESKDYKYELSDRLCISIIGLMRAAAGWRTFDPFEEDQKLKEIESKGTRKPQTIGYNLNELAMYLKDFSKYGPAR